MKKRCRVLVWCSLIGILFPCFPGQSQERPHPASLIRLIETQGVSGYEADVRAYVKSQLPDGAQARTDEIGNLIVTLGQGPPHALMAASLDEHGYVVSQITDDGFLRLHRVTRGIRHRLFDQFHYGQPVTIRTRPGRSIPGVTAAVSVHLHRRRRGGSDPIKGLNDLWVDVGAQTGSEVRRLGIRLLDAVNLRDRVQPLANGRVSGVSARARGGAWALLELLRSLGQGGEIKGTLTLVWTVQEKFGGKGLSRIAQAVKPDRVVLITDRFLPPPTKIDERGGVGRLGAGPLVAPSDSQLLQLAQARNIPIQTVARPRLRWTGYAGGANWVTSDVHAVGLPVMFAQSPVETIDQHDLITLIQLLRAVVGGPGTYTPAPARDAPVNAPQPRPAEGAFPLLRRLIASYAVSGHEAPMREVLTGMLPRWAKPEVDRRGNLTVSFGRGGKRLLFVAHMDEVGYEVSGIREDGTLTLRKRGGFLDSLFEAHLALIHTQRGAVPAVLAPRSNYFSAKVGTPRLDELFGYLGTDSRPETEALGVAVGDSITIPKQLVQLSGTRASGRSIDDRNGCAALLLALKRIDPSRVPNRVTFAWTVEEEIGLRGAAFLSQRLQPDEVFAVDTFVSSDSPLEAPRFAHARLGSGAVVRAVDNSNIAPPAAVARVDELAHRHNIPLTIGVTGGGNDGSVFTRRGSIDIPLAWPLRYSHSPVELIDLRDLDALADLVFALTHEF